MGANAQSVAGIGACFTAGGEFALTGDCPLPVSDVWAESGGGAFRGGADGDAFGQLPQASLVARVAGTVRTALVPLGDATSCLASATYATAPPIEVPTAGEVWEQVGRTVPVDLPTEEGHYVLCAVKGDNYSGGRPASCSKSTEPHPSSPPGRRSPAEGALSWWCRT